MMISFLCVSTIKATTYKLEQVTSVEANGLYVFVQSGRALHNSLNKDNALWAVTGYATTGLTGDENYVWKLESATDGYKMRNMGLSGSPYLKNSSGTDLAFDTKANASVWAFNFQGDNTVIIQNKSNSDRFLGYTDKADPKLYKAYATSNLSGTAYPHNIVVYKLVDESTSEIATPTFSPVAGTYTTAQSVELSCATDGATIYYTTDGSTPTSSSTEYSSAIAVNTSTTLKAVAIKDEVSSSVSSAAYVIKPSTPSIEVSDHTVTITCATASTSIYYTLDGTAPTDEDTEYESAFETSGGVTVKAVAIDAYGNVSDVATYILVSDDIEDGVFNFSKGDYGSGTTLKTAENNFDISEHTWVAGNVSMVVSGRTAWFNASKLYMYKHDGSDPAGKLVITVPDGYVITQVVATGGDGLTASVRAADGSGSKIGETWTGFATRVVLMHPDDGTGRISLTSVAVTYMADTQAVTIGSARHLTYCTPYAMSFEGVTAYVVSEVDENSVTLTEVTEAPANTPVVLRADAGTYNLSVLASASAVGVNYLKVSDGTVVGDGSRYYALAADGEGVVGFHVVGTGVTIPDGKCYLDSENLSAKERLSFRFDDEADGIDAIADDVEPQVSIIYNLQGQRIPVPTRGINIVGGRKLLVR